VSTPQPALPADAVIFDLDGTLLDTLADLTTALNFVRGPLGLPVLSPAEVRPLIGEGLAKLIERACPGAPADQAPALIDAFRSFYADHLVGETALFEGLGPILDELTRRGVPIAILSNKPDRFTQELAERCLAQWDWCHVQGEREDVPAKPDPTSALAIAAKLALPPERIALVGDSEFDVQTAQRAGMASVGCTWGLRDADQVAASHPQHLVHHPNELTILWEG
jgi:phosphoglycolate phosphatase